jgi:alpha-galactosidase
VIDFLRKLNHKAKANFSFINILTGSNNDFIFDRLNLSCLVDDRLVGYGLPGSWPPFLDLQVNAFGETQNSLVIALDLSSALEQSTVELFSFSAELQPTFPRDTKMLINGFQSWSRSELMGERDRLKPLFLPARPLLAPCGDHDLFKYSGKRGRLHSWSYTYFLLADGRVIFFGSLNERSGYTVFNYNYAEGKLMIHKDCKGARVGENVNLLKLFIGTGELDQLFDHYCQLIGSGRPQAEKISGWCSWYNYYTAVSEPIIMQNLEKLSKNKLPLDVFQIDDGWQAAIGDWLDPNSKFPSGMQCVAAAIEKNNFRPGLWLAPFICVPSSKVYQDKPQWLLRDKKGRPVKAGYNPGWEGLFYALDFYAPGVQDYLDQVFKKIQDQWGFRMLKLDFLYAVALLPRTGKSRGQIMAEAIDFITARTKKSILLGCGVPLAPAFGNFEYCRIGSDVGPYWKDYLTGLRYRERVATENSLVCTIARKELDRRFFRNDPDVFILRDGVRGVNENKLSFVQRHTLFLLNNLLGGLIFFSDDVGDLNESQLALLKSSYPLTETKVTAHRIVADLHSFNFTAGEREYLLYANLSAEAREIKITGSYYFHPDHFLVPPGKTIKLDPYQSIGLYKVKRSEEDYYLLGAGGHLFPGAQIEKFNTNISAETIEIVLHRNASPDTTLYVGVPACAGSVTVNGQRRMLLEKDDFRYAKVDFTREGEQGF